MRQGYIVRSNGGWWNLVVVDSSTGPFHMEQSVTHLADCVMLMRAANVTPVYQHETEQWMREDCSMEDAVEQMGGLPDADAPTIHDVMHSEQITSKSTQVVLPADVLVEYHGLDGEDIYSGYYRHIATYGG